MIDKVIKYWTRIMGYMVLGLVLTIWIKLAIVQIKTGENVPLEKTVPLFGVSVVLILFGGHFARMEFDDKEVKKSKKQQT